jgi:hypothetical protein
LRWLGGEPFWIDEIAASFRYWEEVVRYIFPAQVRRRPHLTPSSQDESRQVAKDLYGVRRDRARKPRPVWHLGVLALEAIRETATSANIWVHFARHAATIRDVSFIIGEVLFVMTNFIQGRPARADIVIQGAGLSKWWAADGLRM